MLNRRLLLAAPIPALLPGRAFAATESFQDFLVGLRAEARKAGIAAATLDRALAGIKPNQAVIDRDRKQPEFTMTWARYRGLLVTDKRIDEGRAAVAQNLGLLRRVQDQYGVAAGVVAGIWGLESSFGKETGNFHVVEALATLAWEGRRAKFFRAELIAALKILDHGDIAPGKMTGSYAGAMGQPQFMPTSYLSYAVDFEGHGKRDIWTSKADVLGSIGNYLAKSGWRAGEVWGQQVTLPAGFDASAIGRENKRPLGDWAKAGVRPLAGNWRSALDSAAAIVAPDGAQGEAFVVHTNFNAIRRYNPSDFYAIAVGLIGDQVTG